MIISWKTLTGDSKERERGGHSGASGDELNFLVVLQSAHFLVSSQPRVRHLPDPLNQSSLETFSSGEVRWEIFQLTAHLQAELRGRHQDEVVECEAASGDLDLNVVRVVTLR